MRQLKIVTGMRRLSVVNCVQLQYRRNWIISTCAHGNSRALYAYIRESPTQ